MSFTASAKKMESNGGKVVDNQKNVLKKNILGMRWAKLIGGVFLLFWGGSQVFLI